MTKDKQGEIQARNRGLPADAKPKAGGEFVDLQEIVPVMATFQEHLAAEQRKNRERMRMIVFLFAVLFLAFLLFPVYLGNRFLEQHRAALAAQKAAQDELSKSLSDAMTSLASASRELRQELARRREEPPAPAPAAASPAEVKPEIAPAAVAESPKPAPPPSAPEPPRVEAAAPPAEPAAEPAVVDAAPPAPVADAATQALADPGAGNDLEALLRQVEQAITEKERELKSRKR